MRPDEDGVLSIFVVRPGDQGPDTVKLEEDETETPNISLAEDKGTPKTVRPEIFNEIRLLSNWCGTSQSLRLRCM